MNMVGIVLTLLKDNIKNTLVENMVSTWIALLNENAYSRLLINETDGHAVWDHLIQFVMKCKDHYFLVRASTSEFGIKMVDWEELSAVKGDLNFHQQSHHP